MADQKISDLTAAAAVADTDIFYVVKDPSGTPLDRKMTVAQIKAHIGASAVGDLADFQYVRKSADESVTSSATVQDDDHLTLAIGANQTWEYEFVLIGTSASDTPDFLVDVNAPAAAAGMYAIRGHDPAMTTSTAALRATVATSLGGSGLSCGVTSTNTTIIVHALVRNGVNAGSVTLRWAQNNSNGTATTLKTDSYMIGRRVA